MKHVLIIVLSAVVVTGCGMPWTMASKGWEGQNVDALIESWGQPAVVEETRDGKKSLYFEDYWIAEEEWADHFCGVRFDTDNQGIIQGHTIYGNFGGCSRFFQGRLAPS